MRTNIEDVYDLRILLESHVARLAIPLITDEDLGLDELYAAMTAAAPGEAQLVPALFTMPVIRPNSFAVRIEYRRR